MKKNLSNDCDFSLTFWIKIKDHHEWRQPGSEIYFPSLTVDNGIQVFFAKIGKYFKVYILHPNFGYQKISANAKKFLKNDTFVLITSLAGQFDLYLNSIHVAKVSKRFENKIEVGDCVMAKVGSNDLVKNKISDGLRAILPARVKKVKRKCVILDFFYLNEVATVPKSRLML